MTCARRFLGTGAAILGLAVAAGAYAPPSGTYQASGTETVRASARGRTQRTSSAVSFPLTVDGATVSFDTQPAPWTVTMTGTVEETGRNRFRVVVDDGSVAAFEASLEGQLESAFGAGNVLGATLSRPRIAGVLPRDGSPLRLRSALRVRADVVVSGKAVRIRVRDTGSYTLVP
jgi:hypothetical protein